MYKCKKHPKYKVKLKPRCLCEACWWLWFARKGNKLTNSYASGLQWTGPKLEYWRLNADTLHHRSS